MDLSDLSELELEALRELGNIGVGHAATSFSQLLGKAIEISVPRVEITEISKMHEVINGDKVVAGVVTGLNDMEKGLAGYLYIVFPDSAEKKIAEIMMIEEEMVESALTEIGNIISSAFCDATAEMLGAILMPTPPEFAKDYLIAMIDVLMAKLAEKGDQIIIFDTELKDESRAVNIEVILIPSEGLMEYIKKLVDMVER